MKDLIIKCGTTCGCGNELVPYTKQRETTHYLLTCKAFLNDYDHPLLIAIDKNSPVFIKAEKWDKLMGDDDIKAGYSFHIIQKLEQENKQLKDSIEDLQQSHDTYVKEVWIQHMEIQEYKQKLEKFTAYNFELKRWTGDDFEWAFNQVKDKFKEILGVNNG